MRTIRTALDQALSYRCPNGKKVGQATYGVYAFFDFDGEPIYVGKTWERLGGRVKRHLTNQRTDAVAMSVLDPFEVAEIELWPFWDLTGKATKGNKAILDRAEYTVFQDLLSKSTFGAILNEKPVAKAAAVMMPVSYRSRIVPSPLYDKRKHADIRIARRASTIARLAHIISERAVAPGLRNTLLTQARRLEHLAKQRLNEVGGPPQPGDPGDTDDEDDGKDEE